MVEDEQIVNLARGLCEKYVVASDDPDDPELLDPIAVIAALQQELEDFPRDDAIEISSSTEFTYGDGDEVTINRADGESFVFSFKYDYDGFFDLDAGEFVIESKSLVLWSYAMFSAYDENDVAEKYHEGGGVFTDVINVAVMLLTILEWVGIA